jgi:SAM-dependent methyltransferase
LLTARLEALIARTVGHSSIDDVAARCGLSPERARHLVATYCNEARVGLRLIAPLLAPGSRVLEVGSGIGLVSTLLANEGYGMVAIEPGASSSGFGFMPHIASVVREVGDGDRAFLLDMSVVDLDPGRHGRFDLVFSINVLEHIPDLEGTFSAMASVLEPRGQMVHLCPNYTVPYEPHFNIPLIPGAPRTTRFLFPSVVRKYPGVWDELNFITARRVRQLAARNGLTATFDKGVMGAFFRRLDTDELYRERQGPVAVAVHRCVSALGLLKFIDRVPASCASPMIFRLSRSEQAVQPVERI